MWGAFVRITVKALGPAIKMLHRAYRRGRAILTISQKKTRRGEPAGLIAYPYENA